MGAALKYFRNMEDTVEIFIAGAKRVAKIKGYSQVNIASGTKGVAGLKGSQGTISSYFIGRTRPKPEVMQAIADFLETPYQDILEIGRQEIAKKENPTLDEEEIRRIIREEQKASHGNIESFDERKNFRHHAIIDEFKNHELATEINSVMLEIEKIDPYELEEIRDILKSKLKKLIKKQVQSRDKTASGED